jgi:hypothetical protein
MYSGSSNILNAFQIWMKAITVLYLGNEAVRRPIVSLTVIRKRSAAVTKLIQAQDSG